MSELAEPGTDVGQMGLPTRLLHHMARQLLVGTFGDRDDGVITGRQALGDQR